jgi:hypothetical protein
MILLAGTRARTPRTGLQRPCRPVVVVRHLTQMGIPPVVGRGSTRPPRNHRQDPQQEATVRIGAVVLVVWLLIGLLAAGQRGYLSGSSSNCAKAGNTVITIVAGPLNYVGINPKVKCDVPQPSK